ncbi:MAG: hypothetical protein KDM91_22885 [Verrucomicrobiae bacterium]|nr:hypothetical protein [Verrucomicrobiae bacterium]
MEHAVGTHDAHFAVDLYRPINRFAAKEGRRDEPEIVDLDIDGRPAGSDFSQGK